MNHHCIDKLEVAKRQVKEAILLFFSERDIVVVHTVIASAHQILVDIGHKKGIFGVLKNPRQKSKLEYRKYLSGINSPYNFLKHADKDPQGRINIGPIGRFTQDYIMDAVILLQKLSDEIPVEAKIFWCWYVCSYPDEFEDCPEDGIVKGMMKANLHKADLSVIYQFIISGGFEILANK